MPGIDDAVGIAKIFTGFGDTVSNIWNSITGQTTANNNYDMALKNYQLNKDNLDFLKQSQKQQWEREDTAYQRTRNDMLQAGLNPLTMQGTNGAGEVVSLPQLEAPQKETYQMQPLGKNLMDTLSSVDQAFKGKLERDSLQQEVNRQKIDNALKLKRLGGSIDDKGNITFDTSVPDYEWENLKQDYKNKSLSYDDAKREYDHKVSKNYYNTDTEWERSITAVTDWVANGRLKSELEKIRKEFPWLDSLLSVLEQPKEEKPKKKGIFGF